MTSHAKGKRKGAAVEGSRDRPFTFGWRASLIVLLPASQLLPLAAGLRPDWVEVGFSRGVYPYLSSGLRAVANLVPFSIAEVGLVLLAGLAAVAAFRGAADVVRGVRRPGNALGHGVLNFFAVLGLGAGGWLVLWGLNYQRPTFAVLTGLEAEAPDERELEGLCLGLVERAIALADELPESQEGLFVLEHGRHEALDRVDVGFEVAAETYPVLEWNYARPKPAMLSPVLSVLGVRGIYSPLTGEPHVNDEVTDPELLYTAAHEVAHQVGFAREDEANVVAAVVCLVHPDPDYRWAGLLEVLPTLLAALERVDAERAAELAARVPERMRRDWQAAVERWGRRASPVRDVARSVNDVYLKAQGQEKGVRSYGEVAELLTASLRAVELP